MPLALPSVDDNATMAFVSSTALTASTHQHAVCGVVPKSGTITGQVKAAASGLSLHQWLQTATAEELQFVGEGVVERVAMYAAGYRNA